jgi:hypothetical protein
MENLQTRFLVQRKQAKMTEFGGTLYGYTKIHHANMFENFLTGSKHDLLEGISLI